MFLLNAKFGATDNVINAKFEHQDAELDAEFEALHKVGGGGTVSTDDTLAWKDGKLGVNTTDVAAKDDPRPITAQGVYNEFAVINALLKTI